MSVQFHHKVHVNIVIIKVCFTEYRIAVKVKSDCNTVCIL